MPINDPGIMHAEAGATLNLSTIDIGPTKHIGVSYVCINNKKLVTMT